MFGETEQIEQKQTKKENVTEEQKETTNNTQQKGNVTNDIITQQTELTQNTHDNNTTQLQETSNNTQDNPQIQPIMITDDSQEDSAIDFTKHNDKDLLKQTNKYIQQGHNEQENKKNHHIQDNNKDLKQYVPNMIDQDEIEDHTDWDETIHKRPPFQRKQTNDMDQTVSDTEVTNHKQLQIPTYHTGSDPQIRSEHDIEEDYNEEQIKQYRNADKRNFNNLKNETDKLMKHRKTKAKRDRQHQDNLKQGQCNSNKIRYNNR